MAPRGFRIRIMMAVKVARCRALRLSMCALPLCMFCSLRTFRQAENCSSLLRTITAVFFVWRARGRQKERRYYGRLKAAQNAATMASAYQVRTLIESPRGTWPWSVPRDNPSQSHGSPVPRVLVSTLSSLACCLCRRGRTRRCRRCETCTALTA